MNYGSGSPLPPSCTCGCSGCIWDDDGKTWLICLVLASFVCGCQSKKESNAVLFEKFLDKNVASFAKVMAESGVDTIQAKKYCRCVFTQLYGIDSTFFKLPNDSINSLIDKHSLLIEEKCGNLKK